MQGGPVLETMARASSLVIDKTGTLTHGKAELVKIVPRGQWHEEDLLTIAASLEQSSAHVIGRSIVEAARERSLTLTFPTQVQETAGEGLSGHVDGHKVIVGGHDFVQKALKQKTMKRPDVPPGTVLAAVAISGHLAGHLVLADRLRAETPAAFLGEPRLRATNTNSGRTTMLVRVRRHSSTIITAATPPAWTRLVMMLTMVLLIAF